ncbi:MAG TPA: sigma-70 family RNA polymerase sigma factor [Acidobacteriota bacterium]|nr:sigma-70 family RNA polymerase sigma factor [Acidobacteriota bacterium]HQM64388.1 sigma-70 family RNA polymerase sigma factor [Acidobacteriota bacterium]
MMDDRLTRTLEDARAGSPDALDLLFRQAAGRLLALIRLRMGPRLRDRLESRDILQSTLLKAFDRFDQLRGGDSQALMGWLVRIAENEIRDQAEFHGRRCRDAAKEAGLDENAAAGLAAQLRSQVSRLILDEDALRLEQAMEAIDPHYREIILLRKFEELDFETIGARLEKSPDACRMLLARALAALTVKLKELS